MDDERKRKKFTLYLASGKAADFQTLEAIESVPRSERGELFRECIISGMALHQLDPRLPVLADCHFERGSFQQIRL
nr:plasmid partitioning/stability family protein [Escherichia coli]